MVKRGNNLIIHQIYDWISQKQWVVHRTDHYSDGKMHQLPKHGWSLKVCLEARHSRTPLVSMRPPSTTGKAVGPRSSLVVPRGWQWKTLGSNFFIRPALLSGVIEMFSNYIDSWGTVLEIYSKLLYDMLIFIFEISNSWQRGQGQKWVWGCRRGQLLLHAPSARTWHFWTPEGDRESVTGSAGQRVWRRRSSAPQGCDAHVPEAVCSVESKVGTGRSTWKREDMQTERRGRPRSGCTSR